MTESGFQDYYCFLKERIRYLVVSAALSSVFSIFYALSLEDTYRAGLSLAPIWEANSRAEDSLLGGPYAMSSLELPSGKYRNFERSLDFLTSYSFFVNRLYKYPVVKESFNEYETLQLSHLSFLKNNLNYGVDRSVNIIGLSISHESQELALFLTELILKELKEYLWELDYLHLNANLKSMEYYRSEGLKNDRRVFVSNLIEDRQRQIALMGNKDNYYFRVIEPPYASAEKIGPKRSQICMMITSAGVMLMFSVVSLLYFGRKA